MGRRFQLIAGVLAAIFGYALLTYAPRPDFANEVTGIFLTGGGVLLVGYSILAPQRRGI